MTCLISSKGEWVEQVKPGKVIKKDLMKSPAEDQHSFFPGFLMFLGRLEIGIRV